MTFPGNESPWTKIETVASLYVADASDMNHTPMVCPSCGGVLVNEGWTEDKNNDGEVVGWTFVCSCGTVLRVIND